MKTRLLILVALLFTQLSYAQVTQEWVQRYDGPANGRDQAYSIALDGSGNVYVTGSSAVNGTDIDFATIKYNSEGFLQWVQTYDGPGNGTDLAGSIVVDNFGNAFVTGVSTGNVTESDFATIKYNTNGVLQWVQRYNGPANSIDGANSIALDDSGNVYVTGDSDGPGTGRDYATIKYNSSGVEQWIKRYDGGNGFSDLAHSIAIDPSGNVYITGESGDFSPGGGTQHDYLTIKYSSDGAEQWVQRYNGPGNETDQATSIALDNSGNVYVTGGSMRGGGVFDFDCTTIKYSSGGAEVWVKRYNSGTGHSQGNSIVLDSLGNIYIASLSEGNGTNYDYATIKYSSGGTEQWVQRYNGPGDAQDWPLSIVADPSGNVYITGWSGGSGSNNDYATIKYSPDGTEQWIQRYDGPVNSSDQANSLALDGSGNVYVTGRSIGGSVTSYDYATIKYSQSDSSVAWTNSLGGNFNEGSNWLGGVVPDDNQIALFDSSYYTLAEMGLRGGQPITVTFDQITTTKGLSVGTSQIIFDLQAHSYGVDNLRIESPPGLPDESQLEIMNGVLGTTGEVGIGIDGTVGQLMVNSGGIFEINPAAFSVFYVGKGNCGGGECGRMIIQNGGEVYTNENENGFVAIGSGGGEGSVFISGLGSKWQDFNFLSIGSDGTGLLELSDKAELYANDVWLAETDSSEGILNASGSATGFIIEGSLVAGIRGNAEIHLSSGAGALLEETILGLESGSNGEITVDGIGSFFSTNDTIFIGEFGSGGLSVLAGGNAISEVAVIPGGNGGIGSSLVDGGNSKWEVVQRLSIGLHGVGFARVTNGGTLQAGEIEVGPLGSIDASGGTLLIGRTPPPTALSETQINKNLGNELSGVGGVVFTDTLLISDGAQVLADSVIFGEGGYLGGEGSFSFNVINSGGLNPGVTLNTPGLFTIDANYTQLTNGTLFIELEGDLPGTGFDQLVITGDAQIAGTLNVTALNLFEPLVGQTFEILTANNLSGTFDDVVTHRGLGVSVIYNSTNIVITVTSPVSVEDENNENYIPTEYSLAQNYPNPFNPSTTIYYALPEANSVELVVYDVLGKEIAKLVNEVKPAGSFKVQFDATNLSSGIYFYRLQAGTFIETKKMILLK